MGIRFSLLPDFMIFCTVFTDMILAGWHRMVRKRLTVIFCGSPRQWIGWESIIGNR